MILYFPNKINKIKLISIHNVLIYKRSTRKTSERIKLHCSIHCAYRLGDSAVSIVLYRLTKTGKK